MLKLMGEKAKVSLQNSCNRSITFWINNLVLFWSVISKQVNRGGIISIHHGVAYPFDKKILRLEVLGSWADEEDDEREGRGDGQSMKKVRTFQYQENLTPFRLLD